MLRPEKGVGDWKGLRGNRAGLQGRIWGDVVAQSEGSCSGIWFFPELQEWKWVFMGAEGRLATPC